MARSPDKFVQLLKGLQHEHAVTALSHPKAGDSFEYGRVSGFYQALLVIETKYLELLNEEDKRE